MGRISFKSVLFIIITAIVTALVLMEFFRAQNTGMTHDESYSYTRYVGHPYISIITYTNIIILPNNHILNTVGMKFFSSIFGNSPFVLRFSNLLAFMLYCLMFLLWLKSSTRPVKYIPVVILLFFNPYVLDFFLLARGYGMGMCLMMMSLFCADRLRSRTFINAGNYYLPLIFAALAVYANFGFLNFYLGFIAVIEVLIIYQFLKKPGSRSLPAFMAEHIPTFIVSGVLLVAIYWPMHQIIAAHQLYGGMDGFWANTVTSLINRTFYESTWPHWLFVSVQGIIILSILLSLAVIVFKAVKTKREVLLHPLLHATLFLLLPVLINVIEHRLLNTEFPEDRTGIFYIPLYMFFLVQLFKSFDGLASSLLMYSLSLLLAVNLFLNLHFNYVLEWKYDMNTAKMMTELNRTLNCKENKQEIKLGCNYFFEPSINYYRMHLNMKCIRPLERDGLVDGVKYDYVYAFGKGDWQFKKTDDYGLVRDYPVSGSVLFKYK